MIVRRERGDDVEAVAAIHRAAFARDDATAADGDPPEVGLLAALRTDEGWIPALSLVAVDDTDRPIGHVVCTRGHVDELPVVGLGPIGVLPTCQLQGVGAAMMHAVLGAAEALGEPLVALLGAPAYYGRFGFVSAADVGIESPDPTWGVHFQVRVLDHRGRQAAGRFRYAAPFNEI